jgi:hypothetical protein
MGIGHRALGIAKKQASSKEVVVTISPLPSCPMPHAQYSTTNDSIDLGSILESNKCLQLYLMSSSWVYSLAYL